MRAVVQINCCIQVAASKVADKRDNSAIRSNLTPPHFQGELHGSRVSVLLSTASPVKHPEHELPETEVMPVLGTPPTTG